jgi:pyruvate/2-oxoacid:ferredoxin oxidoreductase alpha subunit
MDDSRHKIREVDKEFGKVFGRSYSGLMEFYKCDDADAVLLLAGTVASTAKEVADKMRKEGKKVGVARLRVFRPFPYEEVRKLASMVGAIGVVDRSYTFGYQGPIACEVQGALYPVKDRPALKNYIVGIGGRDITPEILEKLFEDALKLKAKKHEELEWIGVKGVGGW